VKTTRDFIDKVASISGTSDKLYLIRYEAGKEIKSQEFLLAERGNWNRPSSTNVSAADDPPVNQPRIVTTAWQVYTLDSDNS